ncbi:hypothetical protein [Iodobacter fluviatilis]|uniref:Type III secretion system effector protein OrgC n=1 Tax=Iodobacter fluviatilis TaxID=537 RepID=A0A7G3G5U9_9NEIS|nr:hypothetical protein [Iodobacter fluviatilis]QBC42519.1 hypothetical protein C1H71_02400 [Iodobacter fluviatilis]
MISANSNISFMHNNTFSAPNVHSLSERMLEAAQDISQLNTKEKPTPLPAPVWSETDEAFYQGLLLLNPNDPNAICAYLDKFNASHASPYNTPEQQMKILGEVMSKIAVDPELKPLGDNLQVVQISKWNLKMTLDEWMKDIIFSEGKSPEEVDW